MNAREHAMLLQTYKDWLVKEPSASEKMGWSCDEDQTSRFSQFLKLQDFTKRSFVGSSILDVGCGDGALVSFLASALRSTKFSYAGIDINEQSIALAKAAHKDREFLVGDVLTASFSRTFDVVVTSGSCNVDVFASQERAYEVFFSVLEKMISLAKVGVAVNFLSKRSCPRFVLADEMLVFDKRRILLWLDKKDVECEVIEGYDAVDTTILIRIL